MSTTRPLVLLRAMRPKQWTKNGVVLAAFVFALGDRSQGVGWPSLGRALAAAAIFCLVSSAVYLFNDVRDAPWDRQHPTKKNRPIASGELAASSALAWSAFLLAFALTAAWRLAPTFCWVLAAYLALQVAYTFGLKRIALVDLFVIAGGFVLRALAGAVVIDVIISPWLLLCTLLLALFLALCKRRHEKVVEADTEQQTRPSLAAYDERLLDQLIAIVSAACLVSYALYTLWPETVEKFGTARLGFTIPFVIFGLFRYLDLVYRHEKGGRPEQILLTDLPLLVDVALYGLSVVLILTLH